VPREYDDKSKFLSLAGLTLEDPDVLMGMIKVFSLVCKGVSPYHLTEFIRKYIKNVKTVSKGCVTDE
jgi:hypothetical protein